MTGGREGFVALEDGTVFPGRSVAAPGLAFGEAVFTTAMSGYQEIATDPSYAEQIVCFTAPMVGNYGVASNRDESAGVAARGFVMRRAGGETWCRWLERRGRVALEDVDTRSLVLHLRERGSMRAAVAAAGHEPETVVAAIREQPPMTGRALVAGVSCDRVREVGEGDVRIGLLDYGAKLSIVRRLAAAGARVTVLPHSTTAVEVLESDLDGVVLSNGPGDPAALPDEVAEVRRLLGRLPLLGICLGHQLLALAAGLATVKLPFGHRGANHPVVERASGRVLVTSQNHGFAVQGEGRAVTHLSLYDGTVEGLALPAERARSLQFHPEAGPGPHDGWPLLREWVEEVRGAKAA